MVSFRNFFSRLLKKRFVVPEGVQRVTRVLFQKHLLVTNILIYTSLSAAGDFIQQRYEIHKRPAREYDWTRTYKMSATGVPLGIICHFSYILLDKFLPGQSLRTAIYKMLLNQCIGAPIEIVTFIGTLAILERNTAEQLTQELRTKSVKLFMAELSVWPPAQLINFFFMPLRYRVLYDSTVSLFYETYISYLTHEAPLIQEVDQK